MKRLISMVVFAGMVAAAYGCKKDEASAVAVAVEESTAAKDEAKAEPASTAEGIGIPECDDYISKYESCVKDKIPAASRAAMLDAFKKTRESWQEMAKNEATRANLAQACTQAMSAAKTSMQAMGCEF